MVDLAGEAAFLAKALHLLHIGAEARGEQLDGDPLAGGDVNCLENRTHAAGAELRPEAEFADDLARPKSRRRGRIEVQGRAPGERGAGLRRQRLAAVAAE